LKIGVFDSGIGGLTVTKTLLESNFFSEIIYFGDTARVPYGSKDKNIIIRYALEAVEFFQNFDINLLVVACNTVSAFALSQMRENADFKIIGVIESGIKALLKSKISQNSDILVIGTEPTINSNIYQNLLLKEGFNSIIAIPTPLFVPIIEEGIKGKVLQETFKIYFKNIANPPKAIILGCTHFPLIADEIFQYFNQVPKLIHSGDAIIDYLKTIYIFNKKYNTQIRFFASENPKNLRKIAKNLLGINC
jgi:glutamate racemase